MSAHNAIPATANRILYTGIGVFFVALIYQMQLWGVFDLGLPTAPKNTIGTFYEVTKVTDGDTIHIDKDGTNERVRLIGINTPETVDPRKEVECFGREASNRMKELADGKLVRLEYDESQSSRDTYGRMLAYVYLEDGQMLNRKMVAEGYAYEYTYMTPYRYQEEFRQLQNIARTSGRGLWSPDTCNGKK
jgi:micrococcal nuclease